MTCCPSGRLLTIECEEATDGSHCTKEVMENVLLPSAILEIFVLASHFIFVSKSNHCNYSSQPKRATMSLQADRIEKQRVYFLGNLFIQHIFDVFIIFVVFIYLFIEIWKYLYIYINFIVCFILNVQLYLC